MSTYHKVGEILLLTHAGNDLVALRQARDVLPNDFPATDGFHLHTVEENGGLPCLIEAFEDQPRLVIVRLLGRLQSIAGFQTLAADARARGRHLVVVSGTGEPDPELAVASTVAPSVLHDVTAWFQAGGVDNMAQMLRYLSDHLFMTGYGYTPPVPLLEHGIYHPALPVNATLADWERLRNPDWPDVGITFYRAHWISSNTRFIDTLVAALARRQINALPIFTASLRTLDADGHPAALRFFLRNGACRIDALINTTSFAMGDVNADGPTLSGWSVAAFERLDIPVVQAITSSMTHAQWENSPRGLNPLDTAMNVALPEFDGRVIGVPVSFKQPLEQTHPDVVEYEPLPDRIERIAGIAARLVRLRHRTDPEKRIAFIFTNSNTKASQIGNAVGLDSPASLLTLLHAMRARGYRVDNLPDSSDQLIHDLIERGAYDEDYLTEEQLRLSAAKITAPQYAAWFNELPEEIQRKMQAQWGTPPGAAYVHEGHLMVAGLDYGNAFVALQPPRGYGMDPDAIYHTPDLPPTHHYYAIYRWLRDEWCADAIVHVGKHGTLEWLPGKGVGLSENCFPDALLGDMPLFYPFILNDPGEGSQAKRRAHAVIIDHLTPPMTTADTYGPLAQLTQLVDEYYQVEMLDPAKLPLLQQQIWDLIKVANLDKDLAVMLRHEHTHERDDGRHDAGDGDDHHDLSHHGHSHQGHVDGSGHHPHDSDHTHHDHEWDETLDENGVPTSLAQMEGVDVAHLIEDIDGYLCELGAAQIRDGLHILGRVPEGEALIDMVCALVRLPNLAVPGLPEGIAQAFGLKLDVIRADKGKRLTLIPDGLQEVSGKTLATHADIIDAIHAIGRAIIAALWEKQFDQRAIDEILARQLGEMEHCDIKTTLHYVCTALVPNLQRTSEEIDNLLHGLAGGYVPAGPSGAPTRGMAHVLPTGRNFYSVDPRALPSQSAWRVGSQLATEVIERHCRETGHVPETISISVWGTSAMRTHGDDLAEIFALLGVRPVWQEESHRVTGIIVIPLEQLRRPRIDVTVRISGFFRDAFPHLIHLMDTAIETVAHLDEPEDQNFIRKHYLADLASELLGDLPAKQARSRALYRVFGSKPGTYGAGILPLINEQNWEKDADFAEAYINWGGYAYTRTENGADARADFRHRLSGVEVALHNQDNREHDIFDSDDYLQYHGGMIATIRSLTGRQPRHYFGDSQDPSSPKVRDLKEEVLRVFRSRVVNPKWITSIQRHGYKGGLELTATVDYLFGYDATANVVDDWIYEQVAETYAIDAQMQAFFDRSNPWALNAITERLLEAAQRQMWAAPKPATLAKLRELHLQSEAMLEKRGETSRQGIGNA
jgi:cobaltochelatase CobN